MKRLYLIRHGRPAAAWGEGDLDPGLDAQGLAQAVAARDRLMALPADQRPYRVASSPLRRCLETAAPAAQALGVGIEVVPAVGEVPTPAGLSAGDRPVWLRKALSGRWSEIEGDLDYDLWRREVAAALPGLGGAAVFSHFVAINAVVGLLTGESRVVGFRPRHASITVLETDGSVLTLVAKGEEAESSVL